MDASALVRGLAPARSDEAAIEWLEAAITRRLDALVPELAFAEVANALLVQVRATVFALPDAEAALARLVEIPLRAVRVSALVRDALVLGARHALSVYDGCYLALAERTDAVLVTADRRLAGAARASVLLPEARPPRPGRSANGG